MRNAWANGRRVTMRRRDLWSDREIEIVRRMAGQYDTTAIGREIEREIGNQRSTFQIAETARAHNISLTIRCMRRKDVARELGVSRDMIFRWGRLGLLQTEQWYGIGAGRERKKPVGRPNRVMVVREQALEEFIKKYPYLCNLTDMPQGRWRSLVEVYQRTCHWVPIKAVAMELGMTPHGLSFHARRGLFEICRLPGLGAALFVDGRQIPAIKEAIRKVRQQATQKKVDQMKFWKDARRRARKEGSTAA